MLIFDRVVYQAKGAGSEYDGGIYLNFIRKEDSLHKTKARMSQFAA